MRTSPGVPDTASATEQYLTAIDPEIHAKKDLPACMGRYGGRAVVLVPVAAAAGTADKPCAVSSYNQAPLDTWHYRYVHR